MSRKAPLIIFLVLLGDCRDSGITLQERIGNTRRHLQSIAGNASIDDSVTGIAERNATLHGLQLLKKFDENTTPTPFLAAFSFVESEDRPQRRLTVRWIEVGNAVRGVYIVVGENGAVHEFPVFDTKLDMFEPRMVAQTRMLFVLEAGQESRSHYENLSESIELPAEMLETIYGHKESVYVGLLYNGSKRSPLCEAFIASPPSTGHKPSASEENADDKESADSKKPHSSLSS